MAELQKEFGTFAGSVLRADKELDKLEIKLKSNLGGKDLIKMVSQVRTLEKRDLKTEMDLVRQMEKEAIGRTLDEMNSSCSASEELQKLLKDEVLQEIEK